MTPFESHFGFAPAAHVAAGAVVVAAAAADVAAAAAVVAAAAAVHAYIDCTFSSRGWLGL